MKLARVLTVACLAGCARTDSSAVSQFHETPFRQLTGVELGMTGKRLHAVRPAAKYAPYLGLQERIPGYTVSYQFPTSMMETKATDVGDDDPLEGVFMTEMFDSMEKAESTWRARVREVARSRRAPDLCETFPTGGMQARWVAGDVVLAIGAFPKEPMAPTVGDRVIFAISPLETMKQPPGASKVDCPKA